MELSMWDENTPMAVKQWANAVVTEALRRSILVRPEACEKCGYTRSGLHAHHQDYMRPLEVRWLCPACHHGSHGWRQNPSNLELTKRFKRAMEHHSYSYVGKCLGTSGSVVRSWVSGRSRVYLDTILIVEALRPEEEQLERNIVAAHLRKWRRRRNTLRKGRTRPETGQIG